MVDFSALSLVSAIRPRPFLAINQCPPPSVLFVYDTLSLPDYGPDPFRRRYARFMWPFRPRDLFTLFAEYPLAAARTKIGRSLTSPLIRLTALVGPLFTVSRSGRSFPLRYVRPYGDGKATVVHGRATERGRSGPRVCTDPILKPSPKRQWPTAAPPIGLYGPC